jgi:hypothetical protein
MQSAKKLNLFKTNLRLGSITAAVGNLVFVMIHFVIFQLLNPQHKFSVLDVQLGLFMFTVSFLFSIVPALGGTLFLAKLLKKETWFGSKIPSTLDPFWIGFILGFLIGAGLCAVALIIIGPHMDIWVFEIYLVEVTVITSMAAGIVARKLDTILPKESVPAIVP